MTAPKETPAGDPSPAGGRFRRFGPLLTLAAGTLLAHHPMILTGLARVQGDPGDPRLVNYLLEHSYRWLTRAPGADRLWDPPFFYPTPNALAYSDTLLGVAPLYWPWRAAGYAPETAFQLWLLTCSALNFAAAYALLRGPFRLGAAGATAGAFLFSFGAPRVNQVAHPQLVPHFLSLLSLYALMRLFEAGGRKSGAFWGVAAALALAAQLYAAVYWGVFLGLSLGVAAGCSLAFPDTRRALLGSKRGRAGALLLAAAVGGAAVGPLALHLFRAAAEVGPPAWSEVEPLLPRVWSWAYVGPGSWPWGWLAGIEPFRGLPAEHEHRLGLGLLTPLACLAGLWTGRRRPAVRLAVLTVLVLALLATLPPSGTVPGLWRWVHTALPPVRALRAVARLGVLVLLPASLGLGLSVDALCRRPRLALLMALACGLEQGVTTTSFDKGRKRADVAALARAIDPSCVAFYSSPVIRRFPDWPYHTDANLRGQMPIWVFHLDAMWAGLARGVPTVNGYSGRFPARWGLLARAAVRGPDDVRLLSRVLDRWAFENGLPRDRVDWVTEPRPTPARPGPGPPAAPLRPAP